MRSLSCSTCQPKIIPYLHHQLSPGMQRRVGQHLDACPLCYADYLAQREVANELSAGLPRLGQPNVPQMRRMWSAIQADIHRPQNVTRRPAAGRYGVAILIVMLVFLLPWSLGTQSVAHAIPNQPAPASTAGVTETPLSVAMVTPAAKVNSTYAAIPAAQTPATPEVVRTNP